MSCSCGSKLQDLKLPEEFASVEICDHTCGSPIEKLYYSAKFTPIRVYCGIDEPYSVEGQYPQCEKCRSLPPIVFDCTLTVFSYCLCMFFFYQEPGMKLIVWTLISYDRVSRFLFIYQEPGMNLTTVNVLSLMVINFCLSNSLI